MGGGCEGREGVLEWRVIEHGEESSDSAAAAQLIKTKVNTMRQKSCRFNEVILNTHV